jgi:RNA polymerase sigma-70 factor (ECF subfamily)
MKSDESLYYEYLDGDDDALGELLTRYEESLTLFIYSFVRNIDDAEDLALDAFAVLAASDKKFKGLSTFKTWLFAIGRNQARQYLRKNRLHVQFDENESDITDDMTPELPLLQEEKNRQLYMAMARLNDDYRRVLILKYFQGMGCGEMARVLDRSEKQVSDLLYRGKQALKKELETGGFEYEDH